MSSYGDISSFIWKVCDDELRGLFKPHEYGDGKVIRGNNSEDVKKEYFDKLLKNTFVGYYGERQEFYKNVMDKNVFPMLVDFMFSEMVKQIGK